MRKSPEEEKLNDYYDPEANPLVIDERQIADEDDEEDMMVDEEGIRRNNSGMSNGYVSITS